GRERPWLESRDASVARFVTAVSPGAAGKTVFVHCRLGLNRSAVLAGLMLIDEGFLAADAIRRENLAVLELDVELVRDLLAHVAVAALAQGRLLPVASSVRGRRPPASSTGGREC